MKGEKILVTVDFNNDKPIFQQIADEIANQILNGNTKEGEQVPSTNQIADFYQINPATARKGLNLLTEEGIIFKKRGLGMFVAEGAQQTLFQKRKEEFRNIYIKSLLEESKRLNITVGELKIMIDEMEDK